MKRKKVHNIMQTGKHFIFFSRLTTKMTNPYDISITVTIKRSLSGQLAGKNMVLSFASNSA